MCNDVITHDAAINLDDIIFLDVILYTCFSWEWSDKFSWNVVQKLYYWKQIQIHTFLQLVILTWHAQSHEVGGWLSVVMSVHIVLSCYLLCELFMQSLISDSMNYWCCSLSVVTWTVHPIPAVCDIHQPIMLLSIIGYVNYQCRHLLVISQTICVGIYQWLDCQTSCIELLCSHGNVWRESNLLTWVNYWVYLIINYCISMDMCVGL
jgi:hypothetical protein